MADIRGFTVTEFTSASATWTPDEMPTHESGDLLIALLAKDTTTGFSTSSGWTSYIAQDVSGGHVACQAKRASSGSETFSVTLSSETGVLIIMAIKDCYGSTVSDAWDLSPVVDSADRTTNPYAGISGQSNTYANSLVIRAMGGGNGNSPTCQPPNVNLYNGDAAQGELGLAYTFQVSSGSITQAQWYTRLNNQALREILMSVRASATVTKPGYSDPAVSSATFIRALGWATSNTAFADSWPTSVSLATIGGVTNTYDVGANSADNGTNPYADAMTHTPPSSSTAIGGTQLTFASSKDLDTGILIGCYRFTLHRDGAVDPGRLSLTGGGLNLTLASSGNAYASFIIGGRDAIDVDKSGWNTYAIDWNGAATAWATSGSVNKSAVTYLNFGGRGRYGAMSTVWSMLCLVTRLCLAGGSSGDNLNFEDMDAVFNNCVGVLPVFKRVASQAQIFAPIQIGGGDPVFLSVNQRTFVFPTRYSIANKYCLWNAADDVAGIKFYPKTGDVIEFTNCLFISEDQYRWEFDASSATSGWTGDFSGTVVVGAHVTLQPAMTFSGLKFTECPIFTLNSSVVQDCVFVDTKVSADSPADVEDISDCSFTSSGTGYAIEIGGSAADIDLTGLTFTGYAASDGSTGNEAIYVNIASGSMTINIVGGGNTPSIRTAGCSVTVVNNVMLTVTGIVTGSDIVIYEAGTETVLDSEQNVSSSTFQYTYPGADAGDDIDVGVFKAGYRPYYIRAYELTATDASLPVAQQLDRDYLE